MTDVLRHLQLVPAGGNFVSLHKHVLRLSLDTSHFGRRRQMAALRTRDLTYEEIFCEGSRVQSVKVGRYIKKHGLMPYVCTDCGNDGHHNGKPLVLQIDHRNGVGDDNRRENLRWLCPNCHSQTPTFAGRNSRKDHSGVV